MKPTYYQISVKGHLDDRWTLRFENMTFDTTFDTNNEPVTIMTGLITDHAELYGLMNRLSDHGMKLISIQPLTQNPADETKPDNEN